MKKKPKFKRQQSILKKLKNNWRRPRGLHSKLRLKKGGKGKKPKIGYRKEKKLRYLIKNKETVLIKNIKDLENINKQIIISSNIGLKKKLDIVKKAKELKLDIINIKNIDTFLDKTNKKMEEKRKKRKINEEKKNKKLQKDESKEKKDESKEEKETKVKEEKRKVLEKGL